MESTVARRLEPFRTIDSSWVPSVSLIEQSEELAPSPPIVRQQRPHLMRVRPVLPVCTATPLEALRCSQARAQPTMQPTAPVLHGTIMPRSASSLSPDAREYLDSLDRIELVMETRRLHCEIIARLLKLELNEHRAMDSRERLAIRQEHAMYADILARIDQLITEMGLVRGEWLTTRAFNDNATERCSSGTIANKQRNC
jgi:hypothetical protein